MIRKASKMFVHEDSYAEYRKRHDELWLEMQEEIKKHGAKNYSIFLDEETGDLFAYVEVENEEMWSAIGETEICKKWWNYMAPLMETNENNSPVARPLKSVFYLK